MKWRNGNPARRRYLDYLTDEGWAWVVALLLVPVLLSVAAWIQ